MLTELDAKLIPLSRLIRERNNNPRTKLSDRQTKHVDILTEEMAILSQDLGVDMVIMALIPKEHI